MKTIQVGRQQRTAVWAHILATALTVGWAAPAFSQEEDNHTPPEQQIYPLPVDLKGAQSPQMPPTTEGDHTLLGHSFLTPMLQQSAFVSSYFGIRQGVSFLRVPRLLFGQNLSAAGLQQSFDSAMRLADWLGIYASGGGEVTLGADPGGIIFIGGSYSLNGELGFIVRLLRATTTGTQVSFRLGGGGSTGREFDIKGLVQGVIQDHDPTASMAARGKTGALAIIPTSVVTAAASLLAAQALSRYFSLQAALGVRRSAATRSPFDTDANRRVDQTTKDTDFTGALALTADASPAGVPFAVMAEYQIENDHDDKDGWVGRQHTLGLGLYFTASRTLQLGIGGTTVLGLRPLQGIDQNGDDAKSGTPLAYNGQFVFRHIF